LLFKQPEPLLFVAIAKRKLLRRPAAPEAAAAETS
jgi:hypothetical protein